MVSAWRSCNGSRRPGTGTLSALEDSSDAEDLAALLRETVVTLNAGASES